jgi:XTP/dITP diphosphohydrolase
MKKLVLATNNAGKVKEIQSIMAGLAMTIVPQSDYQIGSIEETGKTFVENAILKARHAAQVTGLPAIADDSGIVVDALQGEPGIYSSRFAGPEATDAQNVEKLLQALQGVPESERGAYFYCCIVLLKHPNDPTPIICHGKCEGRIALSVEGDHGFGYDPIFYLPKQKCTTAQLSSAEKNKISHRAAALTQLQSYFT